MIYTIDGCRYDEYSARAAVRQHIHGWAAGDGQLEVVDEDGISVTIDYEVIVRPDYWIGDPR